jgi:hypothetical protein
MILQFPGDMRPDGGVCPWLFAGRQKGFLAVTVDSARKRLTRAEGARNRFRQIPLRKVQEAGGDVSWPFFGSAVSSAVPKTERSYDTTGGLTPLKDIEWTVDSAHV